MGGEEGRGREKEKSWCSIEGAEAAGKSEVAFNLTVHVRISHSNLICE